MAQDFSFFLTRIGSMREIAIQNIEEFKAQHGNSKNKNWAMMTHEPLPVFLTKID